MTAHEHARASRYDTKPTAEQTATIPAAMGPAHPDDSAANISHADRGGSMSLKGPTRHNTPQTMRGTSPGVVQGYSFGPYNAKKQEKK